LPELASIHEDHVMIETRNAKMDFRDASKCGHQAVGWKTETLVDTVPEMLDFNCNKRDVTATASMISTVTGADLIENLSEVGVTDSVREDDSAKGHFEFRPVDVTIQLKYLSGLSQTKTHKKISLRNSPFDHVNEKVGREGDTVRAVVIYRKNTIASDKFISTNVPSLPLMVENAKDKSSLQVYAKWPSKVAGYDDDSTSMSSTGTQCVNPSSFTLNRTVRMVTFAGQQKNDGHESDYSSNKTAREAHTNGVNLKRNEDQAFLSAISQAFAPELIDLQVGLVKGAKEIIPIGVATVVVSGEFETLDLNIPVLRDYYGECFDARKKHTGFLSSIAASSKKDFVSFSSDKETKYKITDGAFLRLELKIEPTSHATGTPASEYAAKGLAVNNRKTDFRFGPINKAIKSRRKVERLMSLEKLSLQQRLRLYFELRKAPGSYDLPENPMKQANNNEIVFSMETSGVCQGSQTNSSDPSSSFSHQLSSRYDAETDSECIRPHFGAPSRVAPLSEVLTYNAHNGRTNAHSESKDEISSFHSSLQSVLDASHPQMTSAIDMLKKFLACDPSFVLSDNEIDTLKYCAKDCRNVEEDSFSEAYTSGSDSASYVPSRR